MVSADFADRPLKKICLFDVDGTLSLARQTASLEMIQTLRSLRKKLVIGFVGGSDFIKIAEQLQTGPVKNILDEFDYAFSENGLTAFKLGKALPSQSFINFLGEERYKPFVNFILHYIADLDIPIKRGTFVEFRKGMVNVSPVGRNATIQERIEFEALDLKNGYRAELIRALQKNFPSYGLTYAIGGQISFDVYPNGWDKTFALNHIKDEGFEEIHFFGDKTYKVLQLGYSINQRKTKKERKGGNDYEIFTDPRTVGHSVKNPDDTISILKQLFLDN